MSSFIIRDPDLHVLIFDEWFKNFGIGGIGLILILGANLYFFASLSTADLNPVCKKLENSLIAVT